MDLGEYWVEIISLVVLCLGIFFAFNTIGSSFMAYIVIFLWGMFFGRIWYRFRKTFKFGIGMIIFGFLLGFIIGSSGYGNILIIIISYIIGMIISYKLHHEKYIKSSIY